MKAIATDLEQEAMKPTFRAGERIGRAELNYVPNDTGWNIEKNKIERTENAVYTDFERDADRLLERGNCSLLVFKNFKKIDDANQLESLQGKLGRIQKF